MSMPRPASMRREILSAYIATGAKIGSWVIVSALVFRVLGPGQFAVLALIRGTIGLLNYISLGLAPAMIHQASQATADAPTKARESSDGATLSYYAADTNALSLRVIYTNGLFIAAFALAIGIILAGGFGAQFERLFRVPVHVGGIAGVVCLMGIGTLLRLMGDVPGAVLQVRSRIFEDNSIVALGDLLWTVLTISTCIIHPYGDALDLIACWYATSGGVALWLRLIGAAAETKVVVPMPELLSGPIVRQLLGFGIVVVLAQLADYLYAPTDYILIDHLLSPLDIASYAPALQIDGALLLLVSGLSSVMLPRAAVAHAQGDAKTVRRYYVVGTLSSLGLLAGASVLAWVASPWIFRLWLGNPMPETQRILPVLLICTTLGGSSMVGRSILLAVGRVWPFTAAVLIAGVTNVVFSYIFVTRFHWGLRGIVLGTVVAVVARCGIWMPWYVMRVLRSGLEFKTIEQVPLVQE
jgi:O-antigen/teichoic acid export membrane protein